MAGPATRGRVVATIPPSRKTLCHKCPFGENLNQHESRLAKELIGRLRVSPNTLWGCHETAGQGDDVGVKTLLCAGFVKWKERK